MKSSKQFQSFKWYFDVSNCLINEFDITLESLFEGLQGPNKVKKLTKLRIEPLTTKYSWNHDV